MKKSILIAGLFMLVGGSAVLSFAKGASAKTVRCQTTIMKDTVVPTDTTKVPVEKSEVPKKVLNN